MKCDDYISDRHQHTHTQARCKQCRQRTLKNNGDFVSIETIKTFAIAWVWILNSKHVMDLCIYDIMCISKCFLKTKTTGKKYGSTKYTAMAINL